MAGVGSIRRYYRAKEEAAARAGHVGLMLFWRWKAQNAHPATELPDTFPLLSRLTALGYTAIEDLKGPTLEQSADINELTRRGLARKEAAAVIAAMEDL